MTATGRRLISLATCTPVVSALGVACSHGPARVAAECINIVKASGERTDECLPVAPDSQRIDLATPKFSRPTPITNPLHSTSRVEQIIFGGHVDNKLFRTEVTLLPDTKATPYRGTTVDTGSSSTSHTWTVGSRRWPSTGTRRPTTARCVLR